MGKEDAINQRISFSPGSIVATVGALQVASNSQIQAILARHLAGDWGDVDKEDAEANDRAVKWGDRILSSYKVGEEKLWIVTEADRSATIIMTPGEY